MEDTTEIHMRVNRDKTQDKLLAKDDEHAMKIFKSFLDDDGAIECFAHRVRKGTSSPVLKMTHLDDKTWEGEEDGDEVLY